MVALIARKTIVSARSTRAPPFSTTILGKESKIDKETAWSRSAATRVAPDGIPPGWIHEEKGVECTPPDKSRDVNAYINKAEAMDHYNNYNSGQSFNVG